MEIVNQIVMKKISEVKPYVRNPRKNDKTVNLLVEIIPKVGFNVPLVIISTHAPAGGATPLDCRQQGVDVADLRVHGGGRYRLGVVLFDCVRRIDGQGVGFGIQLEAGADLITAPASAARLAGFVDGGDEVVLAVGLEIVQVADLLLQLRPDGECWIRRRIAGRLHRRLHLAERYPDGRQRDAGGVRAVHADAGIAPRHGENLWRDGHGIAIPFCREHVDGGPAVCKDGGLRQPVPVG